MKICLSDDCRCVVLPPHCLWHARKWRLHTSLPSFLLVVLISITVGDGLVLGIFFLTWFLLFSFFLFFFSLSLFQVFPRLSLYHFLAWVSRILRGSHMTATVCGQWVVMVTDKECSQKLIDTNLLGLWSWESDCLASLYPGSNYEVQFIKGSKRNNLYPHNTQIWQLLVLHYRSGYCLGFRYDTWSDRISFSSTDVILSRVYLCQSELGHFPTRALPAYIAIAPAWTASRTMYHYANVRSRVHRSIVYLDVHLYVFRGTLTWHVHCWYQNERSDICTPLRTWQMSIIGTPTTVRLSRRHFSD